jgi:hypothetical protein
MAYLNIYRVNGTGQLLFYLFSPPAARSGLASAPAIAAQNRLIIWLIGELFSPLSRKYTIYLLDSGVTAVLQLLFSESTPPSGFLLKKKPHSSELVKV